MCNPLNTVASVQVGCFPDPYRALAGSPPDQVITLWVFRVGKVGGVERDCPSIPMSGISVTLPHEADPFRPAPTRPSPARPGGGTFC